MMYKGLLRSKLWSWRLAESKKCIVQTAADITILEGAFVELRMTVFSGGPFLLHSIFWVTKVQDLGLPRVGGANK